VDCKVVAELGIAKAVGYSVGLVECLAVLAVVEEHVKEQVEGQVAKATMG